jgi:hypothetical protein
MSLGLSHKVSRLLVSGTHGRNELLDFVSAFDALGHLNAGAHINGQRFAARPDLQDAIGHICRRQSTRQNEVSVDVWRKQ